MIIVKNSLNRLNSRFKQAEKTITEIEIIQKQKDKRIK